MLTVDVDDDYVQISMEDGTEVVYWVKNEWIEDPACVVPAIANAIKMAFENPQELIALMQHHIDAQKEIQNEG